MPHRSESSHSHSRPRPSEYYDDHYTRPRSRHAPYRHQHHHRHRADSYDDLDISRYSKSDQPPHTRPASYHQQHQPDMYANTKMAYPPMPNEQQRRHSSAQYLPVATRYDDEDPYSEGESSYHPHAVRPIRHSTFPPSSYYNSSQQKQVQPYRSPYVHPALPPQSPTLGSAVAKQPQQQFSPPPGDYEPPRYTYQPPTADPPRPSHPVRAETWGHGGALRSGSVKRESGRKGSSVPPSSRSVQDEGHEKPKKTKWQKAKQIYNSKPANNTAELALVGLLAVAKAL